MRLIPYSRQEIDDDDIAAVTAVLRSDFVTQGPAVPLFEEALTRYTGAAHAVALASGTAGLHLACLALGIGPGDMVWTSPMSFAASANCALYVGANIDFVDIDPATGNLDPDALEAKLSHARRTGALPKLLIAVHFSGRPCGMARIAAIARRHGVRVMEDAAHALGAAYENGRVGDCAHSDIAMFSFHPVKSITTGEGGALLTNDAELAQTLFMLRTHGITRDSARLERKDEGAWYYEMQMLGYHYRMTDIQAALGVSQMKKLESFIESRREIAERYCEMLAGLPLDLPPPSAGSAWHLYPVQLQERAPIGRKALFTKLREAGIGVNVHYIPIHLQPYYRRLGFKQGDFPKAEAFYARALSLPVFPGLSRDEQAYVAAALRAML